jgi:hypothetical protein
VALAAEVLHERHAEVDTAGGDLDARAIERKYQRACRTGRSQKMSFSVIA